MDEQKNLESPEENSGEETGVRRELYDWAQALVFSLIFVVVLFTFFARIIGVSGESMEDTLHDADRIVVSNLFYTPATGDIVVLTKESFLVEPIVKRVIATGGQTVNINFETGELWVDDILLDEPYIKEQTSRQGDMQYPLEVPEGFIFVMGDNRNKSADSRWSSLGLVDERYILGRVLFRVFPFDKIGTVS